MKKTSLYLRPEDVARLQRLARGKRASYAAVVRDALAAYEAAQKPSRRFALDGAWEGDGSSVSNVPEEELLRGFGQ
jgi:predicted transcriptional regulator